MLLAVDTIQSQTRHEFHYKTQNDKRHMLSKVWGEITFPIQTSPAQPLKFGMGNSLIPQFKIGVVITNPCWDYT